MGNLDCVTTSEYLYVLSEAQDEFIVKHLEYGPSWLAYRLKALVSKIYIKGKRIRTISSAKEQLVNTTVREEFIAIINYCLMSLYATENVRNDYKIPGMGYIPEEWSDEESSRQTYSRLAQDCYTTMIKKNTDYGEAWRDLPNEFLQDEILVRVIRILSLSEDFTADRTSQLEKVRSQLIDCLNYAVFSVILLQP